MRINSSVTSDVLSRKINSPASCPSIFFYYNHITLNHNCCSKLETWAIYFRHYTLNHYYLFCSIKYSKWEFYRLLPKQCHQILSFQTCIPSNVNHLQKNKYMSLFNFIYSKTFSVHHLIQQGSRQLLLDITSGFILFYRPY